MRRRFRPTRRAALLAGSGVLAVTGAALLVLGLGDGGARLRDVAAPVLPAAAPALPSVPPGEAPAPPSVPPARYTPSSPVHLTVPAVGLDLPLVAMTPKAGAIDPPLLTAGYWIEPYGEPVGVAEDAANTLYVAAHSAGRGSDGFDPLLAGDASTVGPGDRIEVSTPEGTVGYTVQRTQRYGKEALRKAADVWEASPGRLVLITCLQRAGGPTATENLVIFAES